MALDLTPATVIAPQVDPWSILVVVSDATVIEGNSGTRLLRFEVEVSQYGYPMFYDTHVYWSVVEQSATASDFPSGILPAGDLLIVGTNDSDMTPTIGFLDIYIKGDRLLEPDESFEVVVQGVAIINYEGAEPYDMPFHGVPSFQGFILNDDSTLQLQQIDYTLVEGTGTNGVLEVVVERYGATDDTASLDWQILGGNVSPADFVGPPSPQTLPSGTLQFASGASTATLRVPVYGDAIQESDETFTLHLLNGLSGGSSVPITVSDATVTIIDDDMPTTATLSISAGTASRPEGNSGTSSLIFSVDRTDNPNVIVTVPWSVQVGSGAGAANAADFAGGVLPSGQLQFLPGTTQQTIAVSVQGDTLFESDESFTVVLGALQTSGGDAQIGNGSAGALILNDDANTASVLSLGGAGASRLEGDAGSAGLAFTVTRTGYLGAAATVPWSVQLLATSDAASAGDFAAGGLLPMGIVQFAVGASSATFQVPIAGDTLFESDERFSVTIGLPASGSGATYSLGTATATGLIVNDDAEAAGFAPSGSPTIVEGSGGESALSVQVLRTGPLSQSASLAWTVSGASVDAYDFAAGVIPTGRLDFAAGQSSVTLLVPLATDRLPESDESFAIDFTDPRVGGQSIAATVPSVGATIVDDDLTIELFGSASVRNEGSGAPTVFRFTALREGDSLPAVSVDWQVVPVTASTADFVSGGMSGQLTFAVGQRQADLLVSVVGDALPENGEIFLVTLDASYGGGAGAPSATGIILDDDQVGLVGIAV